MSTTTPGGPGRLRIGDTEREAAVSALGEHYAAGRLTREELDERTAAAYAARTEAELWPLFADLPAPARRSAAPTAARTEYRTWWPGAALGPLLLVAIALAVLTHLPWPILLVVGWLWFGRTFRHCFGGRTRSP